MERAVFLGIPTTEMFAFGVPPIANTFVDLTIPVLKGSENSKKLDNPHLLLNFPKLFSWDS